MNQIYILGICLGILQFLLSIWIKARLENSIKHEYDKYLEEDKRIQFRKDQASKIAELFSTWITLDASGSVEDTRIVSRKLNKLTFEIAMWIPDENLVIEVMKRLNNTGDAKDIKEIILSCRELIQDKKAENLKAGAIVHF